MDKTSPVVTVKGLTKKYGHHIAVNDISFEVTRGEVLAILGPNGAGKTTTVEMLEGYRKPTQGAVTVLGVDPQQGTRAWRSLLGMVLQSTSLDAELTVSEALNMYARLYPNPRKIDDVLSLVGLASNANTKIGTLSGGQQRRADVGLGIIGNPELLFLDEPTTGFDPSARRSFWQMIKQLCAEGMTVILTTHYMEEAQFLADRVLLIVNGKIVANAPADKIGGSLRQQNHIAFRLAEKEMATSLPKMLQRQATIEGGSILLQTTDVTGTTSELLDWARQQKIELRELTISRPTLEEIYLALVEQTEGANS